MTPLAGWQNFYVIVGSSAGALIGLQFVVMALVADVPRTPDQAQAGHAFATPNIVHFGSVLFLAAVLCAPWQGIGAAAVCWGLLGLGGVVYSVIVARSSESANNIPARVRRLVVSFSAAFRRLCNAGGIGLRGSSPGTQGDVRGRGGCAAFALHWHS